MYPPFFMCLSIIILRLTNCIYVSIRVYFIYIVLYLQTNVKAKCFVLYTIMLDIEWSDSK